MNLEIEKIIDSGEKIIYAGKPNKNVYIYEKLYDIYLKSITFFFIVTSSIESSEDMLLTILIIIAFIIFIVGSILLTHSMYKKEVYIITDKKIYKIHGDFSTKKIKKIEFSDLSNTILRVKKRKNIVLGDITLKANDVKVFALLSIANYVEIYKAIRKLKKANGDSIHNLQS